MSKLSLVSCILMKREPCFKKRGYTDSDLVEGAAIVEFLSNDGTGVSY